LSFHLQVCSTLGKGLSLACLVMQHPRSDGCSYYSACKIRSAFHDSASTG
jgi:hypothetical protein